MTNLPAIERAISELRKTLRTLETMRNEILDRQGKADTRDADKPVVMVGPDGRLWEF
jgi:hypothetical protein